MTHSYQDLVTAATIGLANKPITLETFDGPAGKYQDAISASDQAAAVLDAMALLTAAHRGGYLPAEAGQRQQPAPVDQRRELPPAAQRIVRWAAATNTATLLIELLSATAAAELLVGAPVLPLVLDCAARDRSLRPVVAAVLGERGRWLAAQRPDWQPIVEAGAEPLTDTAEIWDHGRRGERRAHLAALRRRDPATARDLLATSWARESGDDRADLLAVLTTGLSQADEPFLEAALDDRKAAVRSVAAQLLAQLPESRYAQRAITRAGTLLHVERRALRRRLIVELPSRLDESAERDGLLATPPGGQLGQRAWLLLQLVAAVSLPHWQASFGLAPAALVAVPIDGDFGLDVHAGWRAATVRQRNVEWARALLGPDAPRPAAGSRPAPVWPPDAQLAELLPITERASRVEVMLNRGGDGAVLELQALPGPWPHRLAEAVVRELARAVTGSRPSTGQDRQLARLAATQLPATGSGNWLGELNTLAEQTSQPGLRTDLGFAIEAVSQRRRFFEIIREIR